MQKELLFEMDNFTFTQQQFTIYSVLSIQLSGLRFRHCNVYMQGSCYPLQSLKSPGILFWTSRALEKPLKKN